MDSIKAYKSKLENKLYRDCEMIIELININILAKSPSDDIKAFFIKMIADYQRYVAEMATGDRLEEAKDQARKNYEDANAIDLPACNPIKLGLALNLSVFYYEILQEYQKACQLADKALQEALERIDDLEEDEFREAKAIIELLKENLGIWKEEQAEKNGDDN